MADNDSIRSLRLRGKGNQIEKKEDGEKLQGMSRGRKSILLLFFLTIGLSLIFWLQANFLSWFGNLFGPSTWTF